MTAAFADAIMPAFHAILYYSRDGHTDRLAHALGARLGADIFQIVTASYGTGWLGYMAGGFDSLAGRLPRIEPVSDLSHYASLSLGSPVWTSYPAAPMRAYLAQSPAMPPTIGMFLTSGDPSMPTKAFDMARALCGRPFAATLSVPNSVENTAEMDKRIDAYVSAIDLAVAQGRAK
jgi:hypothetical protein